MYTSEHGGDCCGITHLHDFPCTGMSEKDRIERLRSEIKDLVTPEFPPLSGKSGFLHAVEAVLITSQLPMWERPLRKVGFRPVFSFKNGNSGNICTVFYLCARFRRRGDEVTFSRVPSIRDF